MVARCLSCFVVNLTWQRTENPVVQNVPRQRHQSNFYVHCQNLMVDLILAIVKPSTDANHRVTLSKPFLRAPTIADRRHLTSQTCILKERAQIPNIRNNEMSRGPVDRRHLILDRARYMNEFKSSQLQRLPACMLALPSKCSGPTPVLELSSSVSYANPCPR